MPNTITESDLLESRDVRNVRLDRVNILDKVGSLAVLPDDVHATTEAVASFYGVPENTIKTIVRDHRRELEESGYRVVRGDELRQLRTEFGNQTLSARSKSLALFTRRAVLNVGMLLRDSEVAKQVRAYLLEVEQLAPPDLKKTAYQRLIEKVQCREFRDLIAENACDYAPSDESTRRVFAEAQNLLYRRITNLAAKQIVATREIQTWEGKNGPTKAERNIAKNYLTEDELTRLTKFETLLMAKAEVMFGDGHALTMAQWLDLIRAESSQVAVQSPQPVAPGSGATTPHGPRRPGDTSSRRTRPRQRQQ